MSTSSRLVRTLVVAASLPVIMLALAFVGWVAIVVIAVAHSGSSSMPNGPFVPASVVAFGAGFIFFGWLVALISAASPIPRMPLLLVLGLGLIGGVVALLVPSLANALVSASSNATAMGFAWFLHR